jgi:uncharacterized protein (PEP-CTERM system associated)
MFIFSIFDNQYSSCPSVGLRAALVALLCTGLSIAPVWAGEWDISPRVAVTQSFTDNVLGEPEGEADAFTTASAGVGINGRGGRVNLTLGYDVSREMHVEHSELDDATHSLLGAGDIEFWKDHLFLDGRAAISQELLDRSGRRSATDRSLDSNQTQVLNYSISPRFAHGNDGWADSVLIYRFSQVRHFDTDQGPGSSAANNSTTYELNSYLQSGRRFTRFLWNLSATSSITRQDDGEDSRSQSTSLSGEYRLNHQISVLGSIGFDDREDSGFAEDETSGPTWSVGARLQPGPRTNIRLEYGRQFDDQNWSGDLTYKVGAQTTLTATYSEEIETQQQRVNANLVNLDRLPDGTLIDPATGLPADPNDRRFDFVDESSRNRDFSVGLVGTRGRNTFSVSGFHETREFGSTSDTETNWGVSGKISRNLSRVMSASLSASFSNDSGGGLSGGSEEQSLAANASVGYSFARNLNGSLNYIFSNTDSEGDDNDIVENLVSVRLSKSF